MRRETKFCTQIIHKILEILPIYASFRISVLNSQNKYWTDHFSFIVCSKLWERNRFITWGWELNKNIVSIINNALMHCYNNFKFLALTRLIWTHAVLKLQFSCRLHVFSCFSEPSSLHTKWKDICRHLP